jgi:hypothetical protein
VNAARSLAGCCEEDNSYEVPSLALKIGHTLIKVSQLAKLSAIENMNAARIQEIEYFHEQCKMQWTDLVAKAAHRALHEQKRNKTNILPLSSNVQKLHEYLQAQISVCMDQLGHENHMNRTEKNWRTLAELTLAQIIVFNRKRQGEVSKMKLQDFEKATQVDLPADAQQALSLLEQKLCRLLARVEVRGKRGRIVPVSMPQLVQDVVCKLNEFRCEGGVTDENI